MLSSCGQDLGTVTSGGRPVGRAPSRAMGTMGTLAPDGSRSAVAIIPGLGARDEVLDTVAPDGSRWSPLVRLNTAYIAPIGNAFERRWRTIFGRETDHPLIPVCDCGAAA